MSAPLLPPKRYAVYTRVSSDERLDQSFNSLDAQKDAGRAFIASQRAEGWIPVADDYDDGGYSGGNMERPALRRLMTDIEAGKIDMAVVYKIDRLSRSLADFARMVDVFDRHRVSFSAVTQQINSATSMGRLMLNVLLSFAQFEREVTGERIRDKFAASKAKGMWMGGPVPLGYEVRNRALVIKDDEATLVRRIFDDFVKVGSATQLVKTYAAEGIKTKGGYTLYQAIDLQDAAQPDLPRRDPPQGPIFPRPAFADHHRGAVGRRPFAVGARRRTSTPACCADCCSRPMANGWCRATPARTASVIGTTCPKAAAATARGAAATARCPQDRWRNWSPSRSCWHCRHRTSCRRSWIGYGRFARIWTSRRSSCRCATSRRCGGRCIPPSKGVWRNC